MFRRLNTEGLTPVASLRVGARWRCSNCGRVGEWEPDGYRWYGSMRQIDEGYVEAVLCGNCYRQRMRP